MLVIVSIGLKLIAISTPCASIRRVAPLAWFLPGPKRMRGGAAQRFASDRHFHRGIQAEATCRGILEEAAHYQRLAESRSWRAGFFCGIHLSQFSEATSCKPPRRKPPLQWDNPRRDSAALIERGSKIGKVRRDRCTCPADPPAGPSGRR